MSRLLAITLMLAIGGSAFAQPPIAYFLRQDETPTKPEASAEPAPTPAAQPMPRRSAYQGGAGYMYGPGGQIAFTLRSGNTTYLYGPLTYSVPNGSIATMVPYGNASVLYGTNGTFLATAVPNGNATFLYGW